MRARKNYGAEPPWSGEPRFGLVWRKGEETWDGQITWELRNAPATTADMARLLVDFYLPSLIEEFNRPSLMSHILGVTG